MRRLMWTALGMFVGTLLALALVVRVEPLNRWIGLTFDGRVQSGEPPLDVAGLAAMIGGAGDDAEAARMVRGYYESHRDALAVEFREQNETRLRGLFGMYVTHLAVPYNEVERAPISLMEFAESTAADCGIYATAQAEIYDALGLRWRRIHIDRGWHGLIEVLVGRQYETFDATSNVWVSRSVGEMIGGMDREVRYFYTPILDPATGWEYRDHLGAGYSVPELRAALAWWGISIFPSRWDVVAESR